MEGDHSYFKGERSGCVEDCLIVIFFLCLCSAKFLQIMGFGVDFVLIYEVGFDNFEHIVPVCSLAMIWRWNLNTLSSG